MGNIIQSNNDPNTSGLIKAPPTVKVYSSDGTSTWTAPTGHTHIFIQAFGAGGGGGGQNSNNYPGAGGGGATS